MSAASEALAECIARCEQRANTPMSELIDWQEERMAEYRAEQDADDQAEYEDGDE